MKTIDTVLLTTLICSLVWLGGTSFLMEEYIKEVSKEELEMLYLESELTNSKQLTTMHADILKDIVLKCKNKEKILISKQPFMCYKIHKV